MENWKKIWNSKTSSNANSLNDLISINGYETSGLTSENLKDALVRICFNVGVKGGETLYEVGCGSGAILYTINKMGYFVAGCDYSESLVKIANSLDLFEVECLEANQINVDEKFDYSFSFSVFQYFPNLDYVVKVLDLMLEKSRKGIFILDVNDEDKKDLYHKLRKEAEPNYDEKYKGYEHLFINKEFWYVYANSRKLEITIEDQHIKDYKNSKFRYNIYLKK